MMGIRRMRMLAAGIAAGLCIAPAGANERPVTVELRAGVEYDSNVAILDLDASSGESDVAAKLDLGIGYSRKPAERFGVNAGYYFSQSLHDEFDQFNLQIHRGSAGFGFDVGGMNTGLTANYISAALDGDQFVTMKQFSPHLSRLFGTRLFLRFAHVYTEKDFRRNPERVAIARSLSADAYVFVNGLRTYLVFGYRYDDEDAVAGHFDYSGSRFRTQLVRRLAVGEREVTLRAQLRAEHRGYREPTPSIEEHRRDRRYQFELTADLPIGERVVARLGYKRADNRSNLPSVDFDESVWSLQFRAQL